MEDASQFEADGTELAPGSLRLGGYVIITSDVDRSIDWHERIFGFSVVNRSDYELDHEGEKLLVRQAFLEGMGVALEIMSTPRTTDGVWPVPPHHLFTAAFKTLIISTPDVAEATRSLHARGASFVWANFVLPDGNACSLITDPDGNLYELLGPPGTVGEDVIPLQSELDDYPPRAAIGPPRLAGAIPD